MTAVAASAPRTLATDFVPIVTEVPRPLTPPRVAATPVIEVKLAGAIIRVVSELEDDAQLTAVLRAVRASASKP
jgi:hypothetical protein